MNTLTLASVNLQLKANWFTRGSFCQKKMHHDTSMFFNLQMILVCYVPTSQSAHELSYSNHKSGHRKLLVSQDESICMHTPAVIKSRCRSTSYKHKRQNY